MKFESALLSVGIMLIGIATAILVLDPVTSTENPETQFNVDVSRFSNGDAEFLYRPSQNESLDTLMTYNISIDNKSIESVKNRKVENISYEQPFKVTVQANPDQDVSVLMKIKTLTGDLLHNSTHTVSGEE